MRGGGALLFAASLAPGGARAGASLHVVSRRALYADKAHEARFPVPNTTFNIAELLVIPATVAGSRDDVVLAFAEAGFPPKGWANFSEHAFFAVKRSTDGGATFGPASVLLDCPYYDFLSNMVPILDTGEYGRPPSITVMYNYNNRDTLYIRSLDLGLTWGAPVNISGVTRPPGVSSLIHTAYAGPGQGIQLRHGAHRGRLVVPAVAIFSADPACTLWTVCWLNASRNLAYLSDDGGVTWRAGAMSGCIPGCGEALHGCQCGDEFGVTELSDGTLVGVSRHPSRYCVSGGCDASRVVDGRGGPAITYSHDNGETFGPLRAIADMPSPGVETTILAVPAGTAGAHPDLLLMTAPWSNTGKWTGENWRVRDNMTVSVNVAGGQGAWAPALQLSARPSDYGAYTSMRQLSSGDILVTVATTVDPNDASTGKCTGEDDTTTDVCLYRLRVSYS